MTVIELPDEQAAALKAKAAAQGLTLEAWFQKLAEGVEPLGATEQQLESPRHISEIIGEIMSDVPSEMMDSLPTDGASEHDHYIYGWPKKEA